MTATKIIFLLTGMTLMTLGFMALGPGAMALMFGALFIWLGLGAR